MLYDIIKKHEMDGYPCVKQEVRAMIRTHDGYTFFGSNAIANKQDVCPRELEGYKTGEGYHLCKTICNQGQHAEVNAIYQAKLGLTKIRGCYTDKMLKDSTVYLIGHTYCCDNCLKTMERVGVANVLILGEDSSVIKEYKFK